MKYRKKPVVIEAITFEEFIEYGRKHTDNIVDGMPWSFEYNGWVVTHETDTCYLIPTLEGIHNFTPDDMLITVVKGEIYPCKKDIFEKTYEAEIGKNGMTFDFGEAIKYLKRGMKVARKGWNGKGMHVMLITEEVATQSLGNALGRKMNTYFCIKNVNESVSTWVPSINDCLAEDWVFAD